MSSFVDVRISAQKLAAIAALAPGIAARLPGIAVKSINETAKDAKKLVAKEIKASLSIRLKSVQSRVRMRMAKKSWPAAAIYLDDKPLSLVNFHPRQNKKGVSYAIGKKGVRETLPHAFRQEANNAKQVFKRVAPGDHPKGHIREHAGNAPNPDRYPIEVQRLLSIRQLFYLDNGLPRRLQKTAGENLLKRVDARVKRYLRDSERKKIYQK